MMLGRSAGGRSFGWFLEHHGERVARLHYLGFVEMFWDGYRVELVGQGTWELLARHEAWTGPRVTYRNAATGDVAPHAFPGANLPSHAEPEVTMRGLYVDLRPSLSQWHCYWFKRWSRRRSPRP